MDLGNTSTSARVKGAGVRRLDNTKYKKRVP